MYYYLNTGNSVFAIYVFANITSRLLLAVFISRFFLRFFFTSQLLLRGFYFAVIVFAVIVFAIITGYEIQVQVCLKKDLRASISWS